MSHAQSCAVSLANLFLSRDLKAPVSLSFSPSTFLPKRILILDDHALFGESGSRPVESEPGFEIVADCATIEDALLVIRKKSVDIVLLDFDFGQRDGWDFLRFAAEQEFKGKQWWSRQEWRPPLCLS